MTDKEDSQDDAAPGWEAINAALEPIYGDLEPYHVGTVVPYYLGGPDPIHGISVYANEKPIPYWHFVTYGFSELWDKENNDPEVSGYGIELTFRLVRQPNEDRPPNWALNFLQNLGRYVFETGNVFGPGHTLPCNGPIAQDAPTLIYAISFVHDSQLPPIDTPNGSVEFLQIVGLTMDEIDTISSWNASAFLKLRAQTDPLLLTDLSRQSWLAEGPFAAMVAERSRQEGSSCSWLSLQLECETRQRPVVIRVQSIAVDSLSRRLLGRLPFGRELTLNGKDATVVFLPGDTSLMQLHEDQVTLRLTNQDAERFAAVLQPKAGTYPIEGIADCLLEVTRTEIRDRHGKVVEIVGE